jgi:hypothetical protein
MTFDGEICIMIKKVFYGRREAKKRALRAIGLHQYENVMQVCRSGDGSA